MMKSFILYYAIGAINTLVGFSLILGLMTIGVDPIPSNFTGYLFGALISYYLNSKITFKHPLSFQKGTHFFIVLIFSYLLNLFTLWIFLLLMNPYIAQLLSSGVYSASSYLLFRYYIFKENRVS